MEDRLLDSMKDIQQGLFQSKNQMIWYRLLTSHQLLPIITRQISRIRMHHGRIWAQQSWHRIKRCCRASLLRIRFPFDTWLYIRAIRESTDNCL